MIGNGPNLAQTRRSVKMTSRTLGPSRGSGLSLSRSKGVLMKRNWTIFLIGAVVALLALPQSAAAGVRFGLKGGANIANVNGNWDDTLGDWKSTVGFCGGIFIELNFGKILTIQPEVLYTMKGAATGGGLTPGPSIHVDVRYTMGLQKLAIPDIDTIDLKNGVLSATLGLTF